MRMPDTTQHTMFSYRTLEERIPAKHPLRKLRWVDGILGRHGHTHPGRGRNNPGQSQPSDGDIAATKYWGVPGVLIAPDGSVKMIDHNSGEVSPYRLPRTPRKF